MDTEHKRHEPDADNMRRNLEKLIEIYQENDPSKGKDSEKNKFINAQIAIMTARQSVCILSQWAEAHIIGYFQNQVKDPKIDQDSHMHEVTQEKNDINASGCCIN